MWTFPHLLGRILSTVCSATVLTTVASAQTVTATTDPVGFISLVVPASTGTSASLAFRSLGLVRPIEYQGDAEAVTANTLQDNEATWAANQFNTVPHYVEIIGPEGGAGIGTLYDIAATNAATKTITLAQNLAPGIAAKAKFRVRKHWTIGSVFGLNNEAGLQAGGATSADTVRVYSGGTGNYTSYYYSTGGLPGPGWRKQDGGGYVAVDDVLYPDDGLVITRVSNTPLTLVLVGAVKTGQTTFKVPSGMSIIGNPYAAPMTLADSGLYTGDAATGLAAGGATTADQVQIYNGATYDSYYYSTGGLPGVGWRKASGGTADQAGVQIPVGGAVIIQRRAASGFDWVIAQHPAAL